MKESEEFINQSLLDILKENRKLKRALRIGAIKIMRLQHLNIYNFNFKVIDEIQQELLNEAQKEC